MTKRKMAGNRTVRARRRRRSLGHQWRKLPLLLSCSFPFRRLSFSLLLAFPLFLSLSLSFIQHSCLCTRLLCGGGSKTTRVALNSIMAAVHFFFYRTLFRALFDGKRNVAGREREREWRKEGNKTFIQSVLLPFILLTNFSASSFCLALASLMVSDLFDPF